MLLDFTDSLFFLEKNSFSLGISPININFSLGKISGENVFSKNYLPFFTNSAVDGFAVKFCDVFYASSVNKLFLKVISFSKGNFFTKFSAVEIMTGARIPFNFDVILKIEDVEVFYFNDFFYILVSKKVVKNENIRFIGEDFSPKTLICRRGDCISLHLIVILSSFGFMFLNILNFVKIALFSTGDELKSCLNDFSINFYDSSIFTTNVYQIFNSTAIFILNFFKQLNILVDYYGCFGDNISHLVECFKIIIALGVYNIILSTGAVSKGRHDFILQSFLHAGGKLVFHGVKIKPGKPLLFGVLSKNCVFFGLPGNVLASIFCIRFFVFYFVLKCLFYNKNYDSSYLSFISKKRSWSIDFLYFLKTYTIRFSSNFYYVVSTYDQDSFKLFPLLRVNSFSIFFFRKEICKTDVVKVYSLYPTLL